MQIDFHTSSMKTHVSSRRGGREFVLPTLWKRLIGIIVAVIGMVLIIFSLSTLLVPRSASPYALLFFSQVDPSRPQTDVSIIWVNESRNSIQITRVPNALSFHSQSLGTYPIESIYAAHITTHQPEEEFLTDLSFYLRFPIRGYALNANSLQTSRLSLAQFLMQSCSNKRTSLTIGECLHLLSIFTAFSTNVRELEFPARALGIGTVQSIKPLDRDKYRQWSQSYFSESFQNWKKFTVAVLNGTQTSGLATEASNIIADFGLSILYIGESQSPQTAGQIVISTKSSGNIELRSFLQSTLHMPSIVDDTLPTQYRSDVVVLIGAREVKFFTP